MKKPHLRTRFFTALENHFNLVHKPKAWETILGRNLFLIQGTYRQTPDYDDAWLLALAQEAKTVFDVGCNIGQSSLLLLLPGKVASITLIDPNTAALSLCAENLICNGLSEKARFICAFASNEDGKKVDFFTVGAGAAGSMFRSHAVTANDLGKSMQVPTITLDSLFSRQKILPDLVKIDVEGAEGLVLDEARQIAAQQQTRFFVEMHGSPEQSMEDNADKILAWCKSLGYTAWYLKEKVVLETPGQIAHRGRCHILLLTAGAAFPEYLQSLEQGGAVPREFLTRK
jgi:FkbM family methyltransferase